MNISCLVIDDDLSYCELVAAYVAKDARLALKGKYLFPEEARVHLEQEPIQLVFLDINMPGMSGLEFMKSLTDPPYVIFISSHQQYAIDSYDLNAIDFLMKPINEARFRQAVDKAADKVDFSKKASAVNSVMDRIKIEREYFIIRTDAQYLKIRYIDVNYVEAFSDFIKIHTRHATHIALVNLKTIEKSLPESIFLRIHRSYLVNMEHITAFNNSNVSIGKQQIPIARGYFDGVSEKIIGDRLIKRQV